MAEDARYRLAPLRNARARDEQGKRGDLAAAVGDATAARARLDAARARTLAAREALTAAVTARDALVAAGAPASRLVAAEHFIARRRRELTAATGDELRHEAAHDARNADVDIARRTLARARADREVIERHFTAWREAQRKAAERRED